MTKHIVFKCYKCEHQLFVPSEAVSAEYLVKLMQMECDNCGEEGYENWILSRTGDYEKEYGW